MTETMTQIKANELRVNNWIYDIGDAIIIVDVDIIHDVSIGVERYYPIPLTPEILEKAGDFVNEIVKQAGASNFKYVHQLQNLFFALTNTELEISL
jgi:hypothetical protein